MSTKRDFDPSRVTSAEKLLVEMILSKTSVRACIHDLAERAGPSYVGRYPADTTIKYFEETFKTMQEFLRSSAGRVFTDSSLNIKDLLRMGICTRYENLAHYYRWNSNVIGRLFQHETLRSFLGDNGWMNLHITLFLSYQRYQFAKKKVDDAALTDDDLTGVIMADEDYRSGYVMRMIKVAREVKGHSGASTYLKEFLNKNSTEFSTNQKLLNSLLLRAYLNESVPMKLQHWVGDWEGKVKPMLSRIAQIGSEL